MATNAELSRIQELPFFLTAMLAVFFLREAGGVKPILQALILADHVYRDGVTGKHIVAGIFNRLLFARQPVEKVVEREGQKVKLLSGGMQSGSPAVYINLTEVRGTVPLVLRYTDLETHETLLETRFEVTSLSPVDNVEIVLQMPPLPRPHEGVYSLDLLTDDELIGSFRVSAVELKDSSQ